MPRLTSRAEGLSQTAVGVGAEDEACTGADEWLLCSRGSGYGQLERMKHTVA